MPKDLIDKLQAMAPKGNVLFTAIKELRAIDEIEKFFNQYVEYITPSLAEEGYNEDPRKIARGEIEFCLGHCHERYARAWKIAFKIMDAYPS